MSTDTVLRYTINPDELYDIEDVAKFTGYCTGTLRRLEREKKIPVAVRDENKWRHWYGRDIAKIKAYRERHPSNYSK